MCECMSNLRVTYDFDGNGKLTSRVFAWQGWLADSINVNKWIDVNDYKYSLMFRPKYNKFTLNINEYPDTSPSAKLNGPDDEGKYSWVFTRASKPNSQNALVWNNDISAQYCPRTPFNVDQTQWTTKNGGGTSVSLTVESVTLPDYD